MNIFFLSMSPSEAAKYHANIHVVKMIVETAQLLCNVHHRAREASSCDPPYFTPRQIPYKESRAGHRKLGSMIWVAESLGNYRWALRLGLALCREYRLGRGRSKKKPQATHASEEVLRWLKEHEPNFRRTRRTKVAQHHLAMPEEFKLAKSAVEAYRDYYFSKRKTMNMEWPEGQVPKWWSERQRRYQASRKRKGAH